MYRVDQDWWNGIEKLEGGGELELELVLEGRGNVGLADG